MTHRRELKTTQWLKIICFIFATNNFNFCEIHLHLHQYPLPLEMQDRHFTQRKATAAEGQHQHTGLRDPRLGGLYPVCGTLGTADARVFQSLQQPLPQRLRQVGMVSHFSRPAIGLGYFEFYVRAVLVAGLGGGCVAGLGGWVAGSMQSGRLFPGKKSTAHSLKLYCTFKSRIMACGSTPSHHSPTMISRLSTNTQRGRRAAPSTDSAIQNFSKPGAAFQLGIIQDAFEMEFAQKLTYGQGRYLPILCYSKWRNGQQESNPKKVLLSQK